MSETEIEHKSESSTDAVAQYPKNFKVLLHNDNHTTFDFVIELLVVVFAKSELEAIQVTQAVHEKNVGVAGIYGREVAEQKAFEGMSHAQRYGYPLVLSVEPE